MLPTAQRVTDSAEFAEVIRGGRRTGRSHLVVYYAARPERAEARAGNTRAGFVVSKAVGPAVVRNQVKRRLRHLVAARLAELPAGAVLVVRALPPAAGASSADLGRDLDSALRKLLGQARP
ncbi:MAG TPA: ribonuclease P protein component [Actinocrinis sp.]|nr:ribonuclease P protein component [Actinocrinis sp.]